MQKRFREAGAAGVALVTVMLVGQFMFLEHRVKDQTKSVPIPSHNEYHLTVVNIQDALKTVFGSIPESAKTPEECRLTDDIALGNFSFGNQITPEFLPEFKNPCWRLEGSNDTLCVPYVFLAGFPKCGTTDLWIRLNEHPLMFSQYKEPHFLTRYVHEMYRPKAPSADGSPGYNDHLKETRQTWCTPDMLKAAKTSCEIVTYAKEYFQKFAEKTVLNKDKYSDIDRRIKKSNTTVNVDYKHPFITLDGTASTAWDNNNWTELLVKRNCEEVFAFTPPFIKRVNPEVKVIFILRDPVERTFSDYMYFVNVRATMEEFHTNTVAFIKIFNDCLGRGTSIRTCTYLNQERYGSVRHAISIYHVYLQDWMETFPRGQLYITKTEDYHSNTRGVIEEMFSFLELPALQDDYLTQIAKRGIALQNDRKNQTMFPETRRLLEDFYRPHNERLATLLGDPGMTWDYLVAS